MPPSFYVGLFLIIIGVTSTLFVYYKYTRKAHQKEMEKYKWAKGDWDFNLDVNLFIRLGEKSYILAKLVLMLVCLVFAGFGAFLLWDSLIYFSRP